MEIAVDATSLDRMAAKYKGSGPIIAAETKATMSRAVIPIHREAMRIVPKDTGHLRRSLTYEVSQTGGMTVGKVGSNVPYAKIVEEGRTPGLMPPAGVLTGWMRRHGIDASREFVIRRAINSRKIPRPYLKPALEKQRAAIQREFDGLLKRVMTKIGVSS